jgi:hypothetical protein
MNSIDMQQLFEKSKQHKRLLQQQLNELHTMYDKSRENMKNGIRAVDAPDGISDDMIQQDMDAIEHIIDYAKENESKILIQRIHDKEAKEQAEALKITAVDAPDGTPDAFQQEQINNILQK